MIYGSVCSGIEAATMAWHPLGWTPAFFSEIEDFPRRVLKYHYPKVPLHGDFTTIKGNDYGPIDLLVGGTPCQSFSIAGLRKGMDDDRGNLALEFLKLAQRTRPRWIVWENVPGVLSSWSGESDSGDSEDTDGRSADHAGWVEGERFEESADFACFLEGLQICGYQCAWRVLDAQYFGVAQRRRRVFVVGYLGDWRPAAAVLLERDSLRGNPAPRREKGQKIAPCVTNGPPFSRTGNERVEAEAMVLAERHAIDYEFNAHGVDGPTGPLLKGSPSGGGHPLPPVMDEVVGALDTQCGFEKATHQSINNGHQMPVSAHRMVAFGEYAEDGTASAMKARDHKDATDLIAIHGTQDPDCLKDLAHTLGRNSGQENAIAYAIQERAVCENPDAGPDGVGVRDDNAAYTLEARQTPQAVAFQQNQMGEVRQGAVSGTLNTNSNASGRNTPMAQVGMSVRRLTPIECERLQGFPDGFTDVPIGNKKAADGPRYKALGNSMAVPVMAWIGKRIQMFEDLKNGL